MKFYFLHNHYLPVGVMTGELQVKSVIVPEFYPDLNNFYLGEPCHFNSVESYIKYVVQRGYYSPDTAFAVENSRIINPKCIRETLLQYKEFGVKVIQLYCGADNVFFSSKHGLTREGEQLLVEISDAYLILDLSHLPDDSTFSIVRKFQGRIIVSHCACSDLYSTKKPRSNSLTRNSIYKLSEHVELFGVSFLNDIIAASEYELNTTSIFDDIITQILLFADTVGANKVALSPDYIDTTYFSKRFSTELVFPDTLMTQKGLLQLVDRVSTFLSPGNVISITSGNVERLLQS
jgi:microsomal dipeptidase-like Zn-dependent dipeptidase